MPEWIVSEGGSSSNLLTEEQASNNVLMCYYKLTREGYSPVAIAGITGNMWSESHVNPGQWEIGQFENYNRGYGLGQWTPAQKLVDWANSKGVAWRGNGDNQLQFLIETPGQWNSSYDPGAPAVNPPVTFEEYKTANMTVEQASDYWLYYWEQPSYSQSAETRETRRQHARKYYELITGDIPPDPGTTPGISAIPLMYWAKNIL